VELFLVFAVIFIVPVILAGLVLIYMMYEASNYKLEKINIKTDEDKIKILHISDIHIKFMKVKKESIKKDIETENPDLILLTGDYIQTERDIDDFINFIDVFNGNKFYFVLGNHDYEAFVNNRNSLSGFIEKIKSKGGIYLDNSSKNILYKNRNINIIGVSDIRYGYDDIEKAFKNINKNEYNILISHNPDLALKLKNIPVNLFLCGHFHGGQIRIPFRLEFFVLRSEKLCKMGYISGLYKFSNFQIYINRGIGNVCFPFRFMSKPEITILYV
jgi:predicted MPP superfamily phosphohydrolase